MSLLKEAQNLFDQRRYTDCGNLCKEYLVLHPRDVSAIRLLGNTAIALGFFSDAVSIYQKLLILVPQDPGAHSALARQYYTLRDHSRAQTHAEQASRLAPQLPTPWLVLGCLALENRDESEGLRLFDKSRQAGMTPYLLDTLYADFLLKIGKFEHAGDLLRKLIKQNPDSAILYPKLAWSKKLTQEDSDTEILRSLMDSSGAFRSALKRDVESIIHSNRAMYKLESDLGNYEEAFSHLLNANEPYLEQSPEERVPYSQDPYSGIKQIFTAKFVATRAPLACTRDDPIFIVGMPRSGTTLLERVLSTNPDIVPAGELIHLDRVKQELCERHCGRPDNLVGLLKVPDSLWSASGADYIERARAGIDRGKYFVDKLPGNFINVGFIKSILPNAKVIHLSRHPMATCFSLFEQDFGHRHPYGNDLAVVGSAYVAYHRLMSHWQTIFGDEIIQIRYESLVRSPSEVIGELSEQLGLPLDALSMGKAQENGLIDTASYWQARQPVNTASVERWRKFEQYLDPLANALAPLNLATLD